MLLFIHTGPTQVKNMSQNQPTRGKKEVSSVFELTQGEGRRKTGAVGGIDAHRDLLVFSIVNSESILVEGQVQNNSQGIADFLRTCREYQVESFAVEATSTYQVKLVLAALDAYIPVLLANPQQTAATQGKKTDRFDARRIALAHRDGRLKPSVISPKNILDLRMCTRSLLHLIEQQTKNKQHIHQIFHQYDITLQDMFPNLLNMQWSLQLLHTTLACPDKKITDLIDQYYKRNKRRTNYKHHREVLTQTLSDLRTKLTHLDYVRLQAELVQLELQGQLADQQRLLYVSVAQENATFLKQMKCLLSVPGIGPDTAAITLAELVDIRYFLSPEKLVKWAGLAPRVLQSGTRKHITGSLHKGGNKYLRRALTLACTNIYARGDETHPLYRFMKAKYTAKKCYWLAICAGARKLLCILWHLMVSNTEWNSFMTMDSAKVESIQRLLRQKQLNFERQAERYIQAQARLTSILNDSSRSFNLPTQNPKQLLEILLQAV